MSLSDLLGADLDALPMLLGITDVQRLAAVSENTIRRAVDRGELTPIKRPGADPRSKHLFAKAQVLQWLGLADAIAEERAKSATTRRGRGRPRKEQAP